MREQLNTGNSDTGINHDDAKWRRIQFWQHKGKIYVQPVLDVPGQKIILNVGRIENVCDIYPEYENLIRESLERYLSKSKHFTGCVVSDFIQVGEREYEGVSNSRE